MKIYSAFFLMLLGLVFAISAFSCASTNSATRPDPRTLHETPQTNSVEHADYEAATDQIRERKNCNHATCEAR